MNATKHSRPADPAAAAAVAREADARALKHLKGRLWHFTSIGLGNCRAAQKLRSEMERRQQAEELTRSAAARNRELSTHDPRPLALLSVEQLTAGLSHLVSVGLANTRAAQKIQCELHRPNALNSQVAALNQLWLANDENFNPSEPRDKDGKWTTRETSAANAPAQTPAAANPAKTPTPAPEQKPPPDELRPLTRWERFTSDLRQLEHKWLPGTRTGQLNPSRWPEFKADIGKVLHTLGEFGKAVVGDVAAGMRADPDFSGNLPAFFKGEELPIDKALRDAAEEQKFRGEVPIATVMGRISEGLASTAPLIPLMGGLPAAAQKTALALFTAKMVQDTPEIARQLGTEFGKPPEQRDANKIDSLVAQAIQTVGFAAAGGVALKRSFTPARPPAPENFPCSGGIYSVRRQIQHRLKARQNQRSKQTRQQATLGKRKSLNNSCRKRNTMFKNKLPSNRVVRPVKAPGWMRSAPTQTQAKFASLKEKARRPRRSLQIKPLRIPSWKPTAEWLLEKGSHLILGAQ